MENVLLTKSKTFALRIVRLYCFLKSDKMESIISKQVLRSGTSIGANLAEAQYAVSRKDFLTKIYIYIAKRML